MNERANISSWGVFYKLPLEEKFATIVKKGCSCHVAEEAVLAPEHEQKFTALTKVPTESRDQTTIADSVS